MANFGASSARMHWLRHCLGLLDVDAALAALPPWFAASLHGDLDEIARQLAGGVRADVQTAPPTKWSALHLAAMGGHADVVDALLAAGAAPVCRDGRGRTPAYHARRHGHHELASRLAPDKWVTPRGGGVSQFTTTES